jgi:hypothetical protein
MRELRPWLIAGAALLAACSPAPTKDELRARAIEQSFVGRFVGKLERPAAVTGVESATAAPVSTPLSMRGTRLSTGGVVLVIEQGAPGAGGARSTLKLRVLAASRELEISSDDGARTELYRIESYAAFSGLGELIVSGSAQEAGQPVEVRILYSVEPGRIMWSRDVRPPGGEFKFRERYTMRRAR